MVFRTFGRVLPIVLLIALSFRDTVYAAEEFCPDEASIDLTDATRNATGFFAESGQFFLTEIVRSKNGALLGCMCDVEPCVSLCLPLMNENKTEILGPEHFRNTTAKIPPVYTTNLTLEDDEYSLESEERFHVFVWDPCMGSPAYYLEPDVYDTDAWYLLGNGSLLLPRQNESNAFLDWRQYCFRQQRNHTTYTPRVCSPKPQLDPFRTASYIGGLVSAPFIIATIIVYSVLPELSNIHGNTFRCYLCCLLVTYITLAADRLPSPSYNIGTTCLIFGFLIYFSFLTSFLWLNVMCFDMWSRLRGFWCFRSCGKQDDHKTFIGYSIYAWGVGTLLTAICIGLEFSPSLPESVISPGFRKRSCWFSTSEAAIWFFFGPIGVMIVCNICFFILTSIKLVQKIRNAQKQQSCNGSKRHNDNKLLFVSCLKLFVIMGISWSMEIISGLWKEPKYIWYFTDMVNALQGIVIFIVFVCNKKIWRSLKKRFKCSPRFSRTGCTFDRRSTTSSATISSLDNLTLCRNDSIPLKTQTNASPVG